MTRSVVAWTTALMLSAASTAVAQEPPHDPTELAKQAQNPVANLVSLPLQFNFNSGGDLGPRSLFNLNIQPVIPFALNSSWNFIARPIIPIVSSPGPDETRSSGLGDIQFQTFISPAKPGRIIWGVGPAFSFPTATATSSETGTWGFGPSVVIVKDIGKFVLGGLISQLWPMHDVGGSPETNLFTLQPFVNYNFGRGWALSTGPLITANWDASSGNEWTVPLGLGITRTAVFRGRPMNIGVQYYYNVERPDGSPSSVLRFILSPLFPGGK